MRTTAILLPLALLAATLMRAAEANPPEWIYRPKGNYEGQTDRPLRYWPIGTDFVITNGTEFFNRPLYCLNTAFRLDGGDKPEFSIYLPGRGGNLRFGIKTATGVKWLNDAEKIVARYRPGSLLYEIHDPLLGNRELYLVVIPLSATKGVIVRAEADGAGMPLELVWAFGGANGMKGRRGGDIGCEREPVGQFFQLRPEQCQGNEFTIASNTFVLHSKPATILGVASVGAKLAVADAKKWNCAGWEKAGFEFHLNICRRVWGIHPDPGKNILFIFIQLFIRLAYQFTPSGSGPPSTEMVTNPGFAAIQCRSDIGCRFYGQIISRTRFQHPKPERGGH